jgi:hypothetical protein
MKHLLEYLGTFYLSKWNLQINGQRHMVNLLLKYPIFLEDDSKETMKLVVGIFRGILAVETHAMCYDMNYGSILVALTQMKLFLILSF